MHDEFSIGELHIQLTNAHAQFIHRVHAGLAMCIAIMP